MMVHFRKRLGTEELNWVQRCIAEKVQPGSPGKIGDREGSDPPANGEKLIVDATVVPFDLLIAASGINPD